MFIALSLVAVGVAGRLLPHAWNFAPIVAIGIFSGAYLGKKFAFAVPVAAMVLSDFYIGFYDWKLNAVVYASMGLSGLIGLCLRKRKSPLSIAVCAAAGSILFFLLTNGAVWLLTSMYEPTWHGLLTSYIAGIPFLRNAVLGDIWYSLALFGAYQFVIALHRRFAPAKTLIS